MYRMAKTASKLRLGSCAWASRRSSLSEEPRLPLPFRARRFGGRLPRLAYSKHATRRFGLISKSRALAPYVGQLSSAPVMIFVFPLWPWMASISSRLG